MAKQPRSADSTLPRRQPGQTLTEGDVTGQVGHSQFTRPICGLLTRQNDKTYVCVKDPGHDSRHTPTEITTEAIRRLADRFGHVSDDTIDLAAAPPPPGVDGDVQDDPAPATPQEVAAAQGPPGNALAGDGDVGPGRPGSEMAQAIELERAERVRPDASEAVLGAAMGIINPAAEPGFAITFAEEQARVLVVGQHAGRMFQAVADGQLVDPDDVRAIYRKMRQIAATHDIDLEGER